LKCEDRPNPLESAGLTGNLKAFITPIKGKRESRNRGRDAKGH